MLRKAGFEKIKIAPKDTPRSFIRERLPGKQIEDYLGSAKGESAKSEARTANGSYEIVLVKQSLRAIVGSLLIAILISSANVASAGPFRDFFRALRSAVAHPHETPRPHRSSRSSRSSHKHNETPPSDASNSQTSVSPVPAPPSQRDIRWAKAAEGASQQKTELLYGTPVPGKPGLVTSPFAPDSGYVDVTGFPPATAVEDPYTGKIFLTP